MGSGPERLKFLERLVGAGKADPFTCYALAMEYRKMGRPRDALDVFDGLRRSNPEYVPMYLMAGQLLSALGRSDEARVWLERGLETASAAGDTKTIRELRDALEDL